MDQQKLQPGWRYWHLPGFAAFGTEQSPFKIVREEIPAAGSMEAASLFHLAFHGHSQTLCDREHDSNRLAWTTIPINADLCVQCERIAGKWLADAAGAEPDPEPAAGMPLHFHTLTRDGDQTHISAAGFRTLCGRNLAGLYDCDGASLWQINGPNNGAYCPACKKAAPADWIRYLGEWPAEAPAEAPAILAPAPAPAIPAGVTVTRTLRWAAKVGEDFVTLEETITVSEGAEEAIEAAEGLGSRIFLQQMANLQSQVIDLRMAAIEAKEDPSAPITPADIKAINAALKETGLFNETAKALLRKIGPAEIALMRRSQVEPYIELLRDYRRRIDAKKAEGRE